MLYDGSTLLAKDAFVYGGAITLELETYLTDRIVLLANIRERALWGSSLEMCIRDRDETARTDACRKACPSQKLLAHRRRAHTGRKACLLYTSTAGTVHADTCRVRVHALHLGKSGKDLAELQQMCIRDRRLPIREDLMGVHTGFPVSSVMI